MAERLADQIIQLVSLEICQQVIAESFIQRLKEGNLTRDENPMSHFCVYFPAFDPREQEFFIGHHKKSGLWLFNGGHIDRGESLIEALQREINEEWGVRRDLEEIERPSLLTITSIYNLTKQPCRAHFNIWYFISVDKNNFQPDKSKLDREFFETKWLSPGQARRLVTDTNTLQAMDMIEASF